MDQLYGPLKSAINDMKEDMMDHLVDAGCFNGLNRFHVPRMLTGCPCHPPNAPKEWQFPDPHEKNPCGIHFTRDKIIHAWFVVGAVPFTKQCLQNVKVRHEFREGDPQANEFEAASIRHTNLLLRAAQLGLNVTPFETHVKEQPRKRYLTSLEMLATKKKEELAKVGLKAGAIARELGFTAITGPVMQKLFIAKADELLEKHSRTTTKKRKREEQIQSQAQEILASGKDATAMTKADLDILLKNKGMKPGADKKTSYDMYINSL